MMTGEEIAEKTGVSRSSVYRIVKEYQIDKEGKK